ncbi:hypothetical protein BJX63DRAFT_413803 [Aspergillus granulosus]|uniref:Uncharacterized protein n=1 Tax=Aspergillus granulosus TaxID=176169 RepID=A0ABR4GUT6_9EURO
MRLPASTYGTTWYRLLFPPAEGREFGVDFLIIRNVALGAMGKLQALSVSDDVWHNAVTVQEKMLASMAGESWN